MSLRLFHITEFAESVMLTPERQRQALPPLFVMGLASLWLAVVCNYPLWHALAALPHQGLALVWLDLRLALLMVFATLLLLSLLCWRPVFKPALALLFLLAGLNSGVMLALGRPLDLTAGLTPLTALVSQALSWQSAGLFVLLGLLPALWLWRQPLRRIPVLANLVVNGLVLLLSGALLYGCWWLSQPDVVELLRSQPALQQLLNPWSSLQAWAPDALRALLR